MRTLSNLLWAAIGCVVIALLAVPAFVWLMAEFIEAKRSGNWGEEMKLNEAITLLHKSVEGTGIDVNIDAEKVQIHWFGVTNIECSPAVAAKVIQSLKQLEAFGMEDC